MRPSFVPKSISRVTRSEEKSIIRKGILVGGGSFMLWGEKILVKQGDLTLCTRSVKKKVNDRLDNLKSLRTGFVESLLNLIWDNFKLDWISVKTL